RSPACGAHDLRVGDVRAYAEGIGVVKQLLDPAPPAGHELQGRVDGVLLSGGPQLLGRQLERLVVHVDHRLHMYKSTAVYIPTTILVIVVGRALRSRVRFRQAGQVRRSWGTRVPVPTTSRWRAPRGNLASLR